MNAIELKVEMLRHNDSGTDLADALGITNVTLSNKMNEKGTEFTRGEILSIKDRYNLTDERLSEIFFADELS